MKYIGIDLGTTNSAICAYDGTQLHLFKSPEQHDVTPSAIFIDRRGNRYVGSRAYHNAARNPDNAAILFKRLMGTSTPITLAGANVTMTPEECSAEVLRVLFSYVPGEIRDGGETGTVITVPAAFNQMQKDATLAAADMAGIGKVALIQEPVAAVMSVMRQRQQDGLFLVYDLGGGTLDIAIAESIAGRVSLLAHGGISMCGGRDFDRAVFDHVVKPWLLAQFDLPDDVAANPAYATLRASATRAVENAKIELSRRDEAVISAPETDIGVRDRNGEEIYLDIPITRARFDELIAPKVAESVTAAREALEKGGLTPSDVECVVFVGGPTQYKPLRDKVAFELGVAASTEVNPMTAVAEGAAVFAESIDWASQSRGRKSSRGSINSGGAINVTFNYIARTPDAKAKVAAKLGGPVEAGATFQIDSLDTGWSSGRVPLKDGAIVELGLTQNGDNTFKVFVFDAQGKPQPLPESRVVITRTAATIDAIPASHSIGIEVLDRLGGQSALDYLVREGDPLPKKGSKRFKAAETLRAGTPNTIKFKLFEGDIPHPVDDNRLIGVFEVRGTDFEDGVIMAGAELVCNYEVRDSGNIMLEVSVPSIGGAFHSSRNFYSRQEGQIDFSRAGKLVVDQAQRAIQRINGMLARVDDKRLLPTRERLESAAGLAVDECDPERTKQAMDDVQESKRMLARVRRDNLRAIRQLELDKLTDFYRQSVAPYARTAETTYMDNMLKMAQRAIDSNSADFESHLEELRNRNFSILWRQDWFVIDRFKWLARDAYLFPDAAEHGKLVSTGNDMLRNNQVDRLRSIVWELDQIRVTASGEDQMMAGANIVRS